MKQINPDLSEEQKDVLFNKATEAPFSGEYLNNNENGTYVCANCGAEIFNSAHKYDSHCGWPSFYDARPGSVTFVDDNSHGMQRTEVVCAHCQGHLGHVFDDAPDQPTGQRYCINSVSLSFKGLDT
jgi:peptide-methionine (R)-S-oxide reductase